MHVCVVECVCLLVCILDILVGSKSLLLFVIVVVNEIRLDLWLFVLHYLVNLFPIHSGYWFTLFMTRTALRTAMLLHPFCCALKMAPEGLQDVIAWFKALSYCSSGASTQLVRPDTLPFNNAALFTKTSQVLGSSLCHLNVIKSKRIPPQEIEKCWKTWTSPCKKTILMQTASDWEV